MRFLIGFLVFLALLYTGVWFGTAFYYKNNIENILNEPTAKQEKYMGKQLVSYEYTKNNYSEITINGFPFAIKLKIKGLEVQNVKKDLINPFTFQEIPNPQEIVQFKLRAIDDINVSINNLSGNVLISYNEMAIEQADSFSSAPEIYNVKGDSKLILGLSPINLIPFVKNLADNDDLDFKGQYSVSNLNVKMNSRDVIKLDNFVMDLDTSMLDENNVTSNFNLNIIGLEDNEFYEYFSEKTNINAKGSLASNINYNSQPLEGDFIFNFDNLSFSNSIFNATATSKNKFVFNKNAAMPSFDIDLDVKSTITDPQKYDEITREIFADYFAQATMMAAAMTGNFAPNFDSQSYLNRILDLFTYGDVEKVKEIVKLKLASDGKNGNLKGFIDYKAADYSVLVDIDAKGLVANDGIKDIMTPPSELDANIKLNSFPVIYDGVTEFVAILSDAYNDLRPANTPEIIITKEKLEPVKKLIIMASDDKDLANPENLNITINTDPETGMYNIGGINAFAFVGQFMELAADFMPKTQEPVQEPAQNSAPAQKKAPVK